MSGSKKAWARQHLNDPYVKQANTQGYRSRAAYKLDEIISRHLKIRPGETIIELGSAPGAWTQYLVRHHYRVIACDLLEMEPVKGAEFVLGDFLLEKTQSQMQALLTGKCKLVISDMAPDLTGSDITDQARMHELVTAILMFCEQCMDAEGTLLLKLFNGRDYQLMVSDIRKHFTKTKVIKPSASRSSSKEVYFLAQGFKI
jgi:23S rRNA (uridine2552-2'-O)-methyltransferase